MNGGFKRWPEALAALERLGEAYVLVTVIGTRGSTPRDSGSKMVVTDEQSYDSIGGGHLEFKAIEHARTLLLNGQPSQTLQHLSLGASLGQCCGGHATLLFEHFAARGLPVLVFGAGHVAQALVPILAQLPLRIEWIDSRADQFPSEPPASVRLCISDDPVERVEAAPAGSAIVVLTHNHQLDYELTEAALKRPELGFLGVIGSQTKARRFRQRLQHRGFSEHQIARFVCPIGSNTIPGKRPMEVAVSISAQLIALYQSARSGAPRAQGLDWRSLRALLGPDSSADTTPGSTESTRFVRILPENKESR